jgi:acyl carrier protein
MSRPELAARIMAVIASNQKIPVESITLDKTFAELKMDSLDGINLLFALENEFGIDIPDNAAERIQSVHEMVDGIEKLLAEKVAQPSSDAALGS